MEFCNWEMSRLIWHGCLGVVYMCSILLHLTVGSRDLSQTEENNCSTPARTPRISGLKSQVLKLTFLS